MKLTPIQYIRTYTLRVFIYSVSYFQSRLSRYRRLSGMAQQVQDLEQDYEKSLTFFDAVDSSSYVVVSQRSHLVAHFTKRLRRIVSQHRPKRLQRSQNKVSKRKIRQTLSALSAMMKHLPDPSSLCTQFTSDMMHCSVGRH